MENIHTEELHNESVENGSAAINDLEQSEFHQYSLENIVKFTPTKQSVIDFASKLINDVNDGKTNALRVKQLAKCLEEISKKLTEGTKEAIKNEAEKYGNKPFTFQGSEFHVTTTSTTYDYSGDETWRILSAKLTAREALLRNLKEPITQLDESSGEIVTIHPAVKKQSTGVKITLK